MASHWEVVNEGNVIAPSSAEELWLRATEYFKWCDENHIRTYETLKSGKEAGKKVRNKIIRPYNIQALCLHCGIMEDYLHSIKRGKKKDSLYFVVVDRILAVIYSQNLEMAMIGEFNPIFTAKVLNMESKEEPVGAIRIDIVQGLPELNNSENEILEKLESENQENEKRKEQNS